jgi:hypothetical protein
MADKTATLIVKLKDLASAGMDKLKSASSGLKTAFIGLGAGITALGAFLGKSFIEWGNQKEAVIKLDTAINNVKGTLPGASVRLQELANSLQKTTKFSDDSIVSMQAMLASFGLNEKSITSLTPKILDMSTVLGVDLNTAAMTIGKTISTGSTAALTRYGVALDETKFKSDSVGAVVDSLTSKFEGQAEAVGKGPLGALERLKNSFSDFQETIGSLIEGPMLQFIERMQEGIKTLDENREAFGAVANAVMYFGETVFNVFELATEILTTWVFALTEVASAIWDLMTGDFQGAFDTLSNMVTVSIDSVKEDFNAMVDKQKDSYSKMFENNKKMVEDDKNTKKGLQDTKKQDFEWQIKSQTEQNEKNKKLNEKKFADDFKAQADQNEKNKKLNEKRIEDEIKDSSRENNTKASLEQSFENNLKTIYTNAQKDKINAVTSTLDTISTLQTSHDKGLFIIGKAAAMANAIVSVAQGVAKAWGLGPILGPPMAALVAAAGAVQIGTIAATGMAEGGIVMPREGGTLIRAGEAGKSEAIIPLEDEGVGLIGNNTTINLNVGTLIADDAGLDQLAKILDTKFYNMQRNNESITF